MFPMKKFLFLLSSRDKRRGTLVLAMMAIMALLETAGVASVMPFLGVLGNPELVHTNHFLASAYEAFGFQSVDTFLIALGGMAFGLILFSAVFRTLTYFVMNRFMEMRSHSISKRLLETYLKQPYVFFLNRHSSELATNILSEVDELIHNVVRPGMRMVAYSLVALAVITLLVVVNPVLAAAVAAVIGGLYAAVYLIVRGIVARLGSDRADANKERFAAAGEALAGIKDIKLLGREHAYLSRYEGPSTRQARHQATIQTLAQVPKYFIEAVGFGGIILMALILLALQGGATGSALGDVLPILGLYAFAGYRLLPAAQYIYEGLARLRFGVPVVHAIYEDLRERSTLAEIRSREPEPLVPRRSIALENVSYCYPNAPEPALVKIDLAIPVGTSVGLVGSSGSGKTTLVDVLLGLLRPSLGEVTLDGEPVTSTNLRAWQRTLGYVPQDIFLTDSTMAENIALGVPAKDIDHEHVVRCARMAQIHGFITQEMPEQYATIVGERGVRLSGGQRQRIGIARALYHDPSVLVFDEATSALDTVTEHAVMEAIRTLSHQKTIILVAHRLSTVQHCDQVVILDKGQVSASGTYAELQQGSNLFRTMTDSASGT